MFGSQQEETEGALGVLGAEEAQETAQFPEEGRFQAIAPGAQPGLQEGDGSVEALLKLLEGLRRPVCPAPDQMQGPPLGLVQARPAHCLAVADPAQRGTQQQLG